ncbi:uncharacterized protein PV06_00096 [Exophiala oligosperma]|uniref:Major facilitator superfamily (MFS) profile domain-containing protein n=1 Tax=Exophiala oligosperma TaxID=215243 RepID=A0A0D2DWD5_9EURO|nr:uncharacterized protein PV06_00096 [Exophiala oligosperma]KIW47398.1 hypothetical protein PV06_00096 [Exophiala oligosperma]
MEAPQVNEKVATLDPVMVEDVDEVLTEEEKSRLDRQLVRKLDLKLIPWLTLLYLASFLDRTNVGNAKIEGLQEDLKMTNNQYNLGLAIFFIVYAIFEPLTNVLLKRLRPSVFIPVITIAWGICTTTLGLVHNFGGFLTTRAFLGLTEGGLYPAVIYFLSCWYKRSELGIRMAFFVSAASLAGSFGSLLAAAIAKMDGVGGKAGWAWIFILEGLATVVLGVISFWMVHDFPDKATFLSDAERKRVIRRLTIDQQSSVHDESWNKQYLVASLTDWKTYIGALTYTGAGASTYAFSLFLPTVIKELGYTSTRAQLLSVPPYALAAIMSVAIGYLADRTRARGICNICMALIAAGGFSMLLGAEAAGTRYAGVFLGAMGLYPCLANTLTWLSNNLEGVYKRGLTLGIVIMWNNLNGTVSANIYRGSDAPDFPTGHGVVLGYITVFLLGGSIIQTLMLRAENRKRAT